MIALLKEIIQENYIEDFYLSGFFADDEEPKRFYPNLSYVYIKIGSQYIELEHDKHDYKIHVRVVKRFKPDYEDEGYQNCISSITSQILVSTENQNRINKVVFYGVEDTGDSLVCDALELVVEGQTIFFDPEFLHDITIGGESQKQCWKENFEEFILPHVGSFPEKTCIEF
ncbi:hypothetical protein J25TS5_37310 [Paenibacillus faecis]|uniref:hypothetical protein n=1 Tax=Paenibacillus faecis TaxID=862114 RepID=UPI001B2008A2|nr:hypothetical protein [Paenibacillus faecis]GIO86799.1 hypothetical protein J25TS5_37310 [Paenibacillus faecis]